MLLWGVELFFDPSSGIGKFKQQPRVDAQCYLQSKSWVIKHKEKCEGESVVVLFAIRTH
jgi:hypothetical protein